MQVHRPIIRACILTVCLWLFTQVGKQGGARQADEAVCTEFWLPETLDTSSRVLALKAAKTQPGNEGYIYALSRSQALDLTDSSGRLDLLFSNFYVPPPRTAG